MGRLNPDLNPRLGCLHSTKRYKTWERFDFKYSPSRYGEIIGQIRLWGMRSTTSLPSLPGPLWPGVVAPDRALSMG